MNHSEKPCDTPKTEVSPLSISSKEFVVCDFVSRLWNNYTSLTGGES